jgi:hypothetical protein
VAHVENNDFVGSVIDRVENQEGVSNDGQHADAFFVRDMPYEWKFLEERNQALNPLHDGRCRGAVSFMDGSKNISISASAASDQRAFMHDSD